jgi:hypothetical protein
MSNAPSYSCATSAIAKLSDGKGYSFPVSAFGTGDVLALAILPTAATDRVVFAAPGSTSLQTTDAPNSVDSGSTGTTTGGAPPSASIPQSGRTAIAGQPFLSHGSMSAPEQAVGPEVAPAPRAVLPDASSAALTAAVSNHASNRRAVVIALLLVMAALAWMSAGLMASRQIAEPSVATTR